MFDSCLAELVAASDRTVALTGAGISVPSGIPDFRSPGTGLWENVDPMEVAHIEVFRSEPQRFWQFYRPRFNTLADKDPNEAHRVLAELEQQGRLEAVVTQNIDVLHRKAGSKRIVEVHGTIESSTCQTCDCQFELRLVERSFDGEGVARCPDCNGTLKPDVVLFGEMLPEQAINEAFALASSADLLLCIGSSLQVNPVAMMPLLTHEAGGKVAIITKGETPYDSIAALKLDGDVVSELATLNQLYR